METIQSINLIATNEKVRSGKPYIIGTSVTVADIVITKMYHSQDADGLASWFDLSLPQVYAALAYYYDHKDEMDDQIHHQIRQAEQIREKLVGQQNSLLPR